MKTAIAFLAIVACTIGCGSDPNADNAPEKAPKVDANGIETRENGTTIQRADNGDK